MRVYDNALLLLLLPLSLSAYVTLDGISRMTGSYQSTTSCYSSIPVAGRVGEGFDKAVLGSFAEWRKQVIKSI